jgi:hypothetical protein
MKYYQSLDLIVYNFKCNAEKITETLSIKPTEIWLKGNLTPKFKKPITENSWSYSKTYANDFRPSKNLLNFLNKFNFSELKKIKKSFKIQLVLKTDEDNFLINSDVLEILVKNNIDLEIVYQR